MTSKDVCALHSKELHYFSNLHSLLESVYGVDSKGACSDERNTTLGQAELTEISRLSSDSGSSAAAGGVRKGAGSLVGWLRCGLKAGVY